MKPRPPKAFKDLWVWQQGMTLAVQVFELTKQIAYREKPSVVVPLHRSAIAIPVSIARGFGMGRPRSYIRALLRAYGATQEIETHLHLATELGLVSAEDANRVCLINDEISQTILNMLSAFPMAPELES